MKYILLLFGYFPVKSENRFNKSKSESFGKLRNIKHIINEYGWFNAFDS